MNFFGFGWYDDIVDIIVLFVEYEFEMKIYILGNMFFCVVFILGYFIGSVSFIFDDFVVFGDVLFRGSIGRIDLYIGNLE